MFGSTDFKNCLHKNNTQNRVKKHLMLKSEFKLLTKIGYLCVLVIKLKSNGINKMKTFHMGTQTYKLNPTINNKNSFNEECGVVGGWEARGRLLSMLDKRKTLNLPLICFCCWYGFSNARWTAYILVKE